MKVREKKRTCPRCGNRQVVSLPVCSECSLKFARLESATNTEARKAFKNKEKERVVYVNDIPSDLRKTKFVISLIFGFFGVTSFYVGKKSKGWYSLGSFLVFFVAFYIGVTMAEKGTNMLNYNYYFLTTLAFLCAISFLLWMADIARAISHSYKFPVALPETKDYQKANVRKELYDDIMKEKEEMEKNGVFGKDAPVEAKVNVIPNAELNEKQKVTEVKQDEGTNNNNEEKIESKEADIKDDKKE